MKNAMFMDEWILRLKTDSLSTYKLDEEDEKHLLKLFELTKNIKPHGDDNLKYIWIRINSPSFEEFKEEYEWEDPEEEYKYMYPFDTMWYKIALKHFCNERDKYTYYGVFIESLHENEYILSINDPNTRHIIKCTEFIDFLNTKIEEVTDDITKYNNDINLIPYDYRSGIITRKDYWDIFPEKRKEYRKFFKEEELDFFKTNVKRQEKAILFATNSHSKKMTARNYFEACEIGLKALEYKEKEERKPRFTDTDLEHVRYSGTTPRETYSKYADGRDNGLKNVPLDDADAFGEWLQSKGPYYEMTGNHPWEVVPSFSTSYSLHFGVTPDYRYGDTEDGFKKREEYIGCYFFLSGEKLGRSIDTVKFYNAVTKAGYYVYLENKDTILGRIEETDKIEIVPARVMTGFTYSYEKDVTDCENFPENQETRSKIIAKTKWKPIPILEEKK